MNASALLNIAEEAGIWGSALPLLERQFTKKICFEKMGLFDTAYSDPAQYGRLPEKYIQKGCAMKYYGAYPGYQDYPLCILLHRTKDGNKKVFLRQWLRAVLPREVGSHLINVRVNHNCVCLRKQYISIIEPLYRGWTLDDSILNATLSFCERRVA